MEDIHSSYLSGQEDVDNLPYTLPSLGQNEACAPLPCHGGVEIVLVGGGEPTVGAYPEETGVLTSYSHMGYREESREGMRMTRPREPDGMNLGRPGQDRLSSPYTLSPSDRRSLHHLGSHQSGTHVAPWRYSAADPHEEMDRESDGVSSDDHYLQNRSYEWASGLNDVEGHPQLMMVRSDPPSIGMPAFRRALQFGRHEAWQGGNYSEEDAHVEVEEDEEEEEGSVYTCIECSIYFKKKAHLLEHMFQHSQEGDGEGVTAGEGTHTCGECGKGFGDEESLESHRQLHQESRQKIMEEISKLESLTDEGRDARLQCPKCLFGTNSSKVFVQHAKTHVKKVGVETRTTPTSIRASSEIEASEIIETPNEGIWKGPETEASNEHGWRAEPPQPVVQGPSKEKTKTLTKENSGNLIHDKQHVVSEFYKPTRIIHLPDAAVKLKGRFRETLRAGGSGEEDQRRQLREEVAVVLLENILSKKRQPKGQQACGYGKKHSTSKRVLLARSSLDRHLPRDEWIEDGEDDVPLDVLLMDPKYATQLEALGLRSEERECPYCPDRFHNGIGLANHVRGHLNRVGVSYNVRHFISAEEVKAIEQNYSFQKKRKKVANFDPSTFSLMRCEFCGAGFDTRAGLSSHARAHLRDFGITNWELTVSPIHVLARLLARSPGRPLPPFPPWHQDTDADALCSDEDDGTSIDLGQTLISKPEQSRIEKMASEQNAGRADDSKAVEGEPNRENDCQFCGAWFETRKGLSSHARAHLRHLGVNDPDAKGSPIAALNSLIKSEDFKKRLSEHTTADSNTPSKASGDSTSTDPGMEQSQSAPNTQVKEAGVFTKNIENANKGSNHNSATVCEGSDRPMSAESSNVKLSDSTGPIETSAHFKCPGGTGSSKQIKIVEAGSPHVLSTQSGAKTQLLEAGNSQVKAGTGHAHSKMVPGSQSKSSLPGLTHPRPPPSSTPPNKKLKTSCKSNMNSYWSQKNSSAPLNLSPSSEEVRCEFCGEFFENRKGLSSHARSHLRQMGVTEWHVNGSPIDTLREILASGTCPRTGTRIGSPNSEKLLPHPPSSPSRSHPYSGLAPSMQRKPHRLPTYQASEWPSDLSPLNLSSRADPTRDIRCEFCNEFFENRKGLSSHARSHLRQMGVTEWHVNGSPIDTLREIIRKRRPTPPQHVSGIKKEPRGEEEPSSQSSRLSPLGVGGQGMARDLSPHHNNFLSPMPTKRPASHEPRLTQSEPKGFMSLEPKTCNQSKSYIQGENRPKSFIQNEDRPKTYVQGDGRPKSFLQSSEGRPKTYMQDGRPKGFLQGENRPKTYVQGENKPKTYLQGDGRPKSFVSGDVKHKSFIQGEGKPKTYSPDGKPKAYIQTELPFKVKVKASPEKTVTTLEACCELCGLYFENRKALASHARAHLRQFGVTEWCVNGSPIETLREWMKQRPQKAGAYLSYIQGGRPYSKKFKRASHTAKPGAPERESPASTAGKVAETTERSMSSPGALSEKSADTHGHKTERRHSRPSEILPSRDDGLSEPLPKGEDPRPPVRVRPVPSLVPRPPQTSLVKFVGNIYTLKCRFCDVQFQGPLSIQEQWVRHLQHHILEMNFSKASSPPHTLSSQEQLEPAKVQ